METSSQCCQDLWVKTIHSQPGTFLDVGCGAAEYFSNTHALEKNGWSGTCIDIQRADFSNRSCLYVVGNAIDYISSNIRNQHFCYLSLDIDEDTSKALKAFLENGNTFTAATIEHDKYLIGPTLQIEQQTMLKDHGYVPMFVDIFPKDMPAALFEDWWVLPSVCDHTVAARVSDVEAVNLSQQTGKRDLETIGTCAGLHTSWLTQTR